jgi:hypothetical protein
MTQLQWETIEKSLSELSTADKLELIERINDSIRTEGTVSTDRAAWQRANLDRLRKVSSLAAMPVVEVEDGLSNRDHDEILSTGSGSEGPYAA